MDRDLARAYGTDQPLWYRIRENNIRREFVKAAKAEGINLSDLDDASVVRAYNTFSTLWACEEDVACKTAEAARIGRHMARTMLEKTGRSPWSPIGGLSALREALVHGTPGAGGEALKRLGPTTAGALGLLGLIAYRRKKKRDAALMAELAAQGINPASVPA